LGGPGVARRGRVGVEKPPWPPYVAGPGRRPLTGRRRKVSLVLFAARLDPQTYTAAGTAMLFAKYGIKSTGLAQNSHVGPVVRLKSLLD
jgi:hypothetical protein